MYEFSPDGGEISTFFKEVSVQISIFIDTSPQYFTIRQILLNFSRPAEACLIFPRFVRTPTSSYSAGRWSCNKTPNSPFHRSHIQNFYQNHRKLGVWLDSRAESSPLPLPPAPPPTLGKLWMLSKCDIFGLFPLVVYILYLTYFLALKEK